MSRIQCADPSRNCCIVVYRNDHGFMIKCSINYIIQFISNYADLQNRSIYSVAILAYPLAVIVIECEENIVKNDGNGSSYGVMHHALRCSCEIASGRR